MIEQQITLNEILNAREERVALQGSLLAAFGRPVISFTMNMAGPVKVTAASHRAFCRGCAQLRLGFVQNKFPLLAEKTRCLPTGDEAYFVLDAPAERVKALCVEIEEAEPAGRLYDMDVIGADGRKLDRGAERSCLICGRPGRDCASRRLHSVEELQTATKRLLERSLFALDQTRLALAATGALLEEVAVTPKPGLVDRANNGAHRDMGLLSFLSSANALSGYWAQCWQEGHKSAAQTPEELFARLRPLGKQAEREMLAATGGVNTHKGAIFTLGVLCGAVGRLWTAEAGFPDPDAILNEAAAMTRRTLEEELPAARWDTAGEALYRQYGVRGIRGEVAGGLPAVRELALPLFRSLLAQGLDRNHAAAVTLLRLIAEVEDTNLLHRGGPEGAAWARQAAAALLTDAATGAPRIPGLPELSELDRQMIERNLSPGGCADLLAVTLFLHSLAEETTE